MKISDEVIFLEEVFDVLNKKYFESALQKIAITIQSTPRAHGHFTTWDSWNDGNKMIKEINIGAESLNRSVPEIVATLLHEMVHYYCNVNDIKDTCKNGYYHNKRFKKECEARDLSISFYRGIGFSVTAPTLSIYNLVSEMKWNDRINLYRRRSSEIVLDPGNANGKKTKGHETKKSSTRKYICPKCGMSVRATKEVRIACVDCNNELMQLDKPEEEVHKADSEEMENR